MSYEEVKINEVAVEETSTIAVEWVVIVVVISFSSSLPVCLRLAWLPTVLLTNQVCPSLFIFSYR